MAKPKKDDITHFIEEDIHLPSRTVYIGSVGSNEEDGEEHGVNHAMSERAIKNLFILDKSAPTGDQPITILMNNPGGDVSHGNAIYDAIKMCKNHVTIIVFGQASSMGSIILQAADERIMTPRSILMMHYGNATYDDHSKNVERWVEYNKKYDKEMIEMFMEKIKEVKPEMKDATFANSINFDKILSAKEALELNLIDGILEYDGKITKRNKESVNE
jgi:ATP-dependent Clp protease protease subunit